MIKIAPSILSCDFSKIGEEVARMDACGADYIHIDVMDGHFVPNISFGAAVMKSLNGKTSLPYDVHLMIDRPHRYIERFAEVGSDIIGFHIEAGSDVVDVRDVIEDFLVVPGHRHDEWEVAFA